jgi:hypothetical protein
MLLRWSWIGGPGAGAVLLAACAVLIGCASPAAVRSYARASGDVAGRFPALAADIPASCTRAEGYRALAEDSEWWDDDALAARCKSLVDAGRALLAANRALQQYLTALGAMADDRIVRFDPQLDALTRAVVATDEFPRERVEAVSGLAKLLARAATDGYRRAQLRDAIAAADSDVAAITDGLVVAVERAYLLTLDNERAALDRFYVKVIKEGRAAQPLTALLVLERRDDRLATLRGRRVAAQAYVSALRSIARGHRRLYESRDKLRARELAAELADYAAAIEALASDMEKAF